MYPFRCLEILAFINSVLVSHTEHGGWQIHVRWVH
nr:MAG TPA_asm: hypothetical protein [Caudoviricetes sp.]